MSKIDNAYQYFLATYGKSLGAANRYDTHKRSELRDVYSRMVRVNKNAPLYKIDFTGDVKNFAIDLKEQSRAAQNVVSSLSSDDGNIESVFYKKTAVSSNEGAVKIKYIGGEDVDSGTSFTVGVKKLAKPQVNTGAYLPAQGRDFEEGSYSFDLTSNHKSFEFQFNVNYGDTNNVVQAKIARLVNSSNVGLTASVVRDGKGNAALQLVSKNTGLSEDETELFSIQSGSSWNEVKKLGIANTSQPASNSEFTLNGSEHSSLANTFTINRDFEITLLNTTPADTPARIGFKPNTEAIADSVEDLITSYNGFIAVGEKYRGKHANNQLLNEVHGISRNRASDLSSIGIEENEDGTLTLDRKKLASAVGPGDAKKTFKILNRFKEDLSKEANKTSVNPLNYVDKVTVEYKDPKNVFTAPYASSVYSGLLLDLSL